MASSTLRASVPAWRPRGFVPVIVAAAILVAVPLAAPLLDRSAGGPTTAFASAPSGDYIVLAADNAERTAELISVAPVTDLAAAIPIATVDHLEGFGSLGAVSPDRARLALATVDAGSPTRPGASLLVVDLLTGETTRLAIEADHLQRPLWAPDGDSVVITRTTNEGGATSDVSVVRVPVDLSGETILESHLNVLGAFPFAFDQSGRLLTVVIKADGSTVFRDGESLLHISPGYTRDWTLSPDGLALAYVEANLEAGVAYFPRVAMLEGGDAGVAAQSLSAGQALGSAWPANSPLPVFGNDPSSATGLSAQSALASGFDIPQGYASDGASLVVQHWTGGSFAAPGDVSLDVIANGTRIPITGHERFYGWATR
ncbi:MAG: hypothetical protein ACSLFM_14210 [Tepidiformaceae bacterium]